MSSARSGGSMGFWCTGRSWLIVSALSILQVPTSAIGQSIAPTRDELTRPAAAPAPPRAQLTVAGDIERSACPLADPKFADVKIRIEDVAFNNLKGASAAEMRAAWEPYAGHEEPVAVICEIRDRAATILRRKGYLAAVQVPTQRIEGGHVRLEVLYARVTAVRATGQTSGAERKLAQYLGKLTQDEFFDSHRAERYLLLARDLPGYNVRLTLRPAGTGPGEMIAEVAVIRRPYELDLTLQNLAAKETGPWGAELRAQLFGITGLGDATTLGFYSTSDFKEQQIVQIAHQFRPGAEGLVVDGQFTYAWTRPDLGASAGPVALKARTLFATLGARYPLKRTLAENWTVGGGFDLVNQDVNFFGPLTRDRLRILWLRADFDAVDVKSRRPNWRASGTVELRRGIGVLGASKGCGSGCGVGVTPPSRIDGDPRATLVRASATGEVLLGKSLALAVSPRAQYAFDPVLSFEEFTAGNYTVGRGYDPAIITGDSGVGVATELRGPRLSPFHHIGMQLQPYLFADQAWVWNRNTPGGAETLSSVGGGARADLGDRMRLDATLAVPLKRAGLQTERGDVRFLITLTTRLLPWRN